MGKYSAQVKGGLHANYSATLGSVEPYNLAKDHKRGAQYLAHKSQYEFRQIVDSLVQSGVGGTATYSYSEIGASSELGGVRPVVSTSLINRVTTAQDVSDVRQTLTSLPLGPGGLPNPGSYTPSPIINGDRNPLGTR